MTWYLGVGDVLVIHDIQIELFGGSSGLRDMGQLQSAIFRPQTGHYKDLIEQAAALWESLSQNHPFVDGNKRTAFVCVLVFLKINEVELTATDDEALSFVQEHYESSTLSFDRLEGWLRDNTKLM